MIKHCDKKATNDVFHLAECQLLYRKKVCPEFWVNMISPKDMGNKRYSLRQIQWKELVTRLVTKMGMMASVWRAVWNPGLIWDTLPKKRWFIHPHQQRIKLHQTTSIGSEAWWSMKVSGSPQATTVFYLRDVVLICDSHRIGQCKSCASATVTLQSLRMTLAGSQYWKTLAMANID